MSSLHLSRHLWVVTSLALFVFAEVASAGDGSVLTTKTKKGLLSELQADFEASHASQIHVSQKGNQLLDAAASEKHELISIQSITKSIVTLAIGKLIGDGFIKSIDDPVSKYLPTFQSEVQKKVTIRHVLTHRTGISVGDDFGLGVEQAADSLAYALSAKFDNQPGVATRYNNTAIQLAGGVIESVSGRTLDKYVDSALLAQIGVELRAVLNHLQLQVASESDPSRS